MTTLILCSESDDASVNLRDSLLRASEWGQEEVFSHGRVVKHLICDVHILSIEKIHVHADSIDMVHENEVYCEINEVLVLSRHVSSTDTPAITLHAIGLPGIYPPGMPGKSGGINGQLVPPSPRFASLYREMLKEAREKKLDEYFDLTLEATHHGPVLDSPTLYIEIGSTKSDWSREDALNLWARVLCKVLGLNGSTPLGNWKGEGNVMVGLGGGHYAPRHKAVVENENIWLGHVLAGYSLDFGTTDHIAGGRSTILWQDSILSAIESTKKAFPGADIFVHLDRKSFKGWQRDEISKFLAKNDILIRRGKEISQE